MDPVGKGPTPPKFNIAPETWWLEDYSPIEKVIFSGAMLFDFMFHLIKNIQAVKNHHICAAWLFQLRKKSGRCEVWSLSKIDARSSEVCQKKTQILFGEQPSIFKGYTEY